MPRTCLVVGTLILLVASLPAADTDAARRGEQALRERSFNPPFWSKQAYDNAWRKWEGRAEPPADYAQAVMDRYGLHPAPYPNHGLPMGLRETTFLFRRGIANDCLLCHGGSIAGQSYIGLGNATLDMQTLFEEMSASEGNAKKTPFTFCNVRGTNEAAAMSVFLLAYREPDLKLRAVPLELGLRADLCEDVPAWWLLRKKKTMYYTGATSARSVRSLMQFMMHPLNLPETFQREEKTFADIQAFLLTLRPPKYPFPVNAELAKQGQPLFEQHCARCHGTYGAEWKYPNKIVPIDDIGTDRTRLDGLSVPFGEHYNKSWFAQGKQGDTAVAPVGYQAPPLDGVWATAPYFHNGSAPTVYHVLNSKARPRRFTRSYHTGKDDYDPVKLGWKIDIVDQPPDPALPARERRKVYDTSQRGRGNGGHTFGDKLSDTERAAVIEYLKTL